MNQRTCTVAGCTKPIKRTGWCYGHYMKNWRHGTPTPAVAPKWTDITGQQFGTLTALERIGRQWRCACICGVERSATAGELNRTGDANTCGTPGRHLDEACTYNAAHDRVKNSRGTAKTHACIDCGTTAAHWSYRHDDPDEQHELIGRSRVAYSPNPEHYDPRCVPCHKRFDLHRLDAVAV